MEKTYETRNDYLIVKVMGHFDINHSKLTVFKTDEKLRKHSLKKLFLDITEVKGIDKKDILPTYRLSSLMKRSFPRGTMISLVETKEQMGDRSFFEDILTNMGFQIHVTTNPEEGLKWLYLRKNT